MSPAGGRGYVPAYDRLPFETAFPKNHWQSPASPQWPPAAPQAPNTMIVQDPLPAATGCYAETGRAVTLVHSFSSAECTDLKYNTQQILCARTRLECSAQDLTRT